MANLIYRSTTTGNIAGNPNKGVALTIGEVDGNFYGLQVDVNTRVLRAGDTFSGNVLVSGTGTAQLNTTGDIWSYRTGGTTGALYLNNTQSRGLVNDGTNYQLPSQGLMVGGVVQGTSFSGAGTGLTGTAGSLSIGGVAATATNLSGGSVFGTTGVFSSTFGVTGTSSHIGNATFTSGVSLVGETSNLIDFNTTGIAAPTFTTRSAGTKIVLYPAIGPSLTDYALGIDSATLWFSVPTSASLFKWYGGTTLAATLTGSGALTLVAGLTATTGSFNSTLGVSGITSLGSNINISGNIVRAVANAGYLDGNNASGTVPGCIFTIGGGPYYPTATTLGTMYGIGYGYSGNCGITATNAPGSQWGMYVADNGTSRIFLSGTSGAGYFNGGLSASSIGVSGNAACATVAATISIGLASENLITQKTTTTLAVTPVSIMGISGVAVTGYRSVDFIVQAVDAVSGKFHTAKLLVVHNGSTADYTEYGTINVGGACGVFSVSFATGILSLMVTPSSANSTIFKVFATATHI